MSYWEAVPVGTWRVADTVDAINALRDPESRYILREKRTHVVIYGPPNKALIVDLSCLNCEQLSEFLGG